ncbi:hypothetical protein A2U01_0020295, partial [Trifolium medium]|nr:hypothetical protein [Trifolium medium]
KKAKKGLLLVWHAVIWVLWRTRNEKIFSNMKPVLVGHGTIETDEVRAAAVSYVLTKLGASSNSPMMVLGTPPPDLSSPLGADAWGVAFVTE